MNLQPAPPPTEAPRSRAKTITLWCISVGIIVPGGYGFIEKFIQFIRTLRTDEGGGFTIVPITNYLIMAAGFTCLLIWATTRGMFRDIEKPKFTMLEREAQLEQHERMQQGSA